MRVAYHLQALAEQINSSEPGGGLRDDPAPLDRAALLRARVAAALR